MTEEELKYICNGKISSVIIATYLPILNELLPVYKIDNKLRLSAFISQLLHESEMFKYSTELGSGLQYEGRKDLGNTEVGDGKRFKGRGLIQITGRYNYQLLKKEFNIDLIIHPELLATPYYAVKSAMWFWNTHKLNELADKSDFKTITKRINGGLNGYEKRLWFYNQSLKILK